MKNNFNLRDYLYNNPLLTEGLDLKASEIEDEDNTSDKEEVEEMSSSKMTKTELKEKIRAEIMATLSEESTVEEAPKPCTPELRAKEAEIIAEDLELSGEAKEKFIKELLVKTSTCKDWSKFYDIADEIGSKLTEAEGEDDLDAALDAAEDEVGDEAPADDTPADEPAGAEPELSDEAGLSDEETAIQADLKKAYDNAVTIGDEKLANQIANTITFFTRAHVVPRTDQ